MQTQMITKEMTIGEVVEQYPQAADVFTNFGLHCVGCHSNPFETIEGGTLGHGMPEEEMNNLLVELNKIISSAKTSSITAMSVTENAALEIKNLLDSQRKSDHGLKIKVVPGGCAGYKYEINFVKAGAENDMVIEDKGLKLFIDPASSKMLQGCTIDYVAGLMGAGFKVLNPNEQKACGCGSSVGF